MSGNYKIFCVGIGMLLFHSTVAQGQIILGDSKYESNGKNQSIHLILKSDSTYAYEEFNHIGGVWLDSGSWFTRCDLVILNSVKTTFFNRRNKKEGNKSIRPIFDNTCFRILTRDSLLYSKRYSPFYLVKRK